MITQGCQVKTDLSRRTEDSARKGLKRIFKDAVLPKKSAKRPKVAKAKPIKAQEEELEEIPVSKTTKCSEEELQKKRRLQEAVEI